MIPVDGGVARIPIMATADTIRCTWERYQQRRADKKARKAKEQEYKTDNKARLNELRARKRYRSSPAPPVLVLDEAMLAMGAIGIDPETNFTSDCDERFHNNPHGVGCSKYFETPSPAATESSSSCSTPKSASTPESITTVDDDDLLSASKVGSQPFPPFGGPELLCWPREKRKGRASADEPKDFYFSKEQRKAYNKLLSEEKQQERIRKGKAFLLNRVPSWKN
jgi:hypothetical protein